MKGMKKFEKEEIQDKALEDRYNQELRKIDFENKEVEEATNRKITMSAFAAELGIGGKELSQQRRDDDQYEMI